MLGELHYVSGNQDGSVSLWDIQKKKPLVSRKHAHGEGHWITAVAAVAFSDLAASGISMTMHACMQLLLIFSS